MVSKTLQFFSVFVLLAMVAAGCDQTIKSEVVNVEPYGDEVPVERDTVVVDFDRAMKPSTFSTGSFRVEGELSGIHTGVFSFPSTTRVRFTIDGSFEYSERVTITLTNGVESASGKELRRHIHAFQIEDDPGAPAPFDLAAMTPEYETVDVPRFLNLTATFNNQYNPFTVDSNSVLVSGSKSGNHGVIFQNLYAGLSDIDMNFDRAFLPGERVTLTLSDRITAVDGGTLEPAVISYMVRNIESRWPTNSLTSSDLTEDTVLHMFDVDQDGREEWVAVSADGTLSAQELQIDNTLSAAYSTNIGAAILASAFGDFNADGSVDLVCLADNKLHLFFGKPNLDEFLNSPLEIVLSVSVKDIRAGHFDSDGMCDLFLSLNDENDGAVIAWGDRVSPLDGHDEFDTMTAASPAVCADFDGDLTQDIAYLLSNGNIAIEWGLGDREFGDGPVLAPSAAAVELMISNLNGDDVADLIAIPAAGNAASVFEADEDGDFASVDLLADQINTGSALVDLDGDGDLDLLTPNAASVAVYDNPGDGAFGAVLETHTTTDSVRRVILGDMNGDGSVDLGYELTNFGFDVQLAISGDVIANEFKINDIAAMAGDTDVPFEVLGSHEDAIEGFTIVMSFDTAVVTLDTLSSNNTDAGRIGAEVSIPNIDNVAGVATLAVIFDFMPPFDGQTLERGVDHQLAMGTLTVDAATLELTTDLVLENNIGSPAVSNNVLVAGLTVEPALSSATLTIAESGVAFVRGDANGDGIVDVSDSLLMPGLIAEQGASLDCQDVIDVNDDGILDLSDNQHLLNFLYYDGPQPSAPFPLAGLDATADSLTCDETAL